MSANEIARELKSVKRYSDAIRRAVVNRLKALRDQYRDPKTGWTKQEREELEFLWKVLTPTLDKQSESWNKLLVKCFEGGG